MKTMLLLLAHTKYIVDCRDSNHGKSELENVCENRVAVVVLSSSYTTYSGTRAPSVQQVYICYSGYCHHNGKKTQIPTNSNSLPFPYKSRQSYPRKFYGDLLRTLQ